MIFVPPVATVTQTEYCLASGQICPVCQSVDISADGLNVDGNELIQAMSCNVCTAEWKAIYVLDRYEPAILTITINSFDVEDF